MTYILFDFDGPIVDLFEPGSEIKVTQSIADIGKKFGVGGMECDQSPYFILAWDQKRQAVARALGDVAAFDRSVHKEIELHELDMVRHRGVTADSAEMLDVAKQLADGVGIVSNNSAKAISHWLLRNGLADLVDFVSGRNDQITFDSLKPNPYLLIRAIRELQCQPGQTVFFGDTESDWLSSQAANVRFVGVRTRHSVGRIVESHPQVFLLESHSAVTHYIEKILLR